MLFRSTATNSVTHIIAVGSEPLGIAVAVEIIPNELSRPAALAHFVETLADDVRAGVCLDIGHARLAGDVVDAIENVSEHLIAAHVHDNRGRLDEHLLPFEGTVDWAAALTALQKVGYDGPLTFEVGALGAVRPTLAKLRDARTRIEKLLAA